MRVPLVFLWWVWGAFSYSQRCALHQESCCFYDLQCLLSCTVYHPVVWWVECRRSATANNHEVKCCGGWGGGGGGCRHTCAHHMISAQYAAYLLWLRAFCSLLAIAYILPIEFVELLSSKSLIQECNISLIGGLLQNHVRMIIYVAQPITNMTPSMLN